jgi:TRAP-type C4-dicarboxylate transport system substrate-binding protein
MEKGKGYFTKGKKERRANLACIWRIRTKMAALLMLMLFSLSLPAVGLAQSVTWRLHGDQAVTFWWSEELQKFADEVTQATKGEVKLEFYPSSSLGVKAKDILAPVGSGAIEMAEFVASYVAGEAPYLTIFGLPMIAANVEEGRKIMDATRAKIESKLAEDYDLKLLASLSSSPLQLYLGKNPFKNIESFRGLRIRTLGVDQEFFIRSLGATPVNVPIGDMPTAVATNQVDGAIAGTQYFVLQKFAQYGPNILAWNAILGPGYLVVGQKKWQSISPAAREAILKVSKSFEARVWARAATLEDSMQKQAEGDGFKILHLTPADRADLVAKAEPAWRNWAKRAGQLGQELLKIAMKTSK